MERGKTSSLCDVFQLVIKNTLLKNTLFAKYEGGVSQRLICKSDMTYANHDAVIARYASFFKDLLLQMPTQHIT